MFSQVTVIRQLWPPCSGILCLHITAPPSQGVPHPALTSRWQHSGKWACHTLYYISYLPLITYPYQVTATLKCRLCRARCSVHTFDCTYNGKSIHERHAFLPSINGASARSQRTVC